MTYMKTGLNVPVFLSLVLFVVHTWACICLPFPAYFKYNNRISLEFFFLCVVGWFFRFSLVLAFLTFSLPAFAAPEYS